MSDMGEPDRFEAQINWAYDLSRFKGRKMLKWTSVIFWVIFSLWLALHLHCVSVINFGFYQSNAFKHVRG